MWAKRFWWNTVIHIFSSPYSSPLDLLLSILQQCHIKLYYVQCRDSTYSYQQMTASSREGSDPTYNSSQCQTTVFLIKKVVQIRSTWRNLNFCDWVSCQVLEQLRPARTLGCNITVCSKCYTTAVIFDLGDVLFTRAPSIPKSPLPSKIFRKDSSLILLVQIRKGNLEEHEVL